MTEDDENRFEDIKSHIWGGFRTDAEIRELTEEILSEGGGDGPALRLAVAAEIERKRFAERGWPVASDYDRIHEVFEYLHGRGVCALHNAGYTISMGHWHVSEVVAEAPDGRYHGFCFYHHQDVARAVQGLGLSIAFGDLDEDDERGVKVGEVVVAALREAGFVVNWNGSIETRPDLPGIVWQKRSPRPATTIKPTPQKPWWDFWS